MTQTRMCMYTVSRNTPSGSRGTDASHTPTYSVIAQCRVCGLCIVNKQTPSL